MSALRRFINELRDSPTYGRDRASLLSAIGIGTTALLLNGAVLMLVLPLMLDPNDRDFRMITENIEFGQLLALSLLGGSTVFATVLIPLRLVTVFWGPRTGRYFDQIVLSGISPVRYVIGKATSQNLFLSLIMVLLLPYLVLSLTLGGVELQFFLAGLFLVWLYCMALALVTLWLSTYVNELLAALTVIYLAAMLAALGCVPISPQPAIVTPFPTLIHPVWSAIPSTQAQIPQSYPLMFGSCVLGMSSVIAVSLFGIYLGPLFGIIRENSTFGEVVRAGDSKRKRWMRIRHHIQRPSEISFFYENRDESVRRSEGLIRWGAAFGGLLALRVAASYVLIEFLVRNAGGMGRWWVAEFHVTNLLIHGVSLAVAVYLFSHSKNTTYLRVPFLRGRLRQVSRLDTVAFVAFLVLSTVLSVGTPFLLDNLTLISQGTSVFDQDIWGHSGRTVDSFRIVIEGTLVVSVGGILVYLIHRQLCLATWLKSSAFVVTAAVYALVVCVLPFMLAIVYTEVPELQNFAAFRQLAPEVSMASPITVMIGLFNEFPRRFSHELNSVPLYVLHGVLTMICLLAISRRGRKLRKEYLDDMEASS